MRKKETQKVFHLKNFYSFIHNLIIALLNTLKAEYDFFLALSNNAAEVHDKIKQLGTQNLVTNIISR